MSSETALAWKQYVEFRGEASFAEFYQATSHFIFTIAMKVLRSEEEAFDVMQGVYGDLLELAEAPDAQDLHDLDQVIRRLTLRRAYTLQKRKSRDRGRYQEVEDLDYLVHDGESSREQVHRRQIEQQVRSVVETLPDELRIPVVMHYEQGMTHQEIASAMGCSRSQISRQIAKAEDQMGRQLRALGVESVAGVLGVLLAATAVTYSPPAYASSTVVFASIAGKTWVGTMSRAMVRIRRFAPRAGYPVGIAFLVAVIYLGSEQLMRYTRQGLERPVTSSVISLPQRSNITAIRELNDGVTTETPKLTAASGGGAVEGWIVNRNDRLGLGNIPLVVTTLDGPTSITRVTATEADGTFRVYGLPDGKYQVSVDPVADGWVPESREVNVGLGETADAGIIFLQPYSSLQGVVTTDGGEPLAGAALRLAMPGVSEMRESKTDENGQFAFSKLIVPHYAVYLPEYKYYQTWDPLKNPGQLLEIELGAGEFRGKIQSGSASVDSASVMLSRVRQNGSLERVMTRADADGLYALRNVPSGRWNLEVQSPLSNLRDRWPIHREVVNVLPSGNVHNVTPETGAIYGNVQIPAGEMSQPLTITAVREQGGEGERIISVASDNEGKFTFPHCPSGTYHLSTRIGNYVYHGGPVTVGSDPAPQVSMTATRSSGTLTVHAYSSQDGSPLKGAWLELEKPGYIARVSGTDEDGVLRIEGVEPGRYNVRISGNSLEVSDEVIVVHADVETEVKQVLQPAGVVMFEVVDENGIGAENAVCELTYISGSGYVKGELTGRTDSAGTLNVRGVVAGIYRATVEVDGKSYVSEHVVHAKTPERVLVQTFSDMANSNEISLANN